MNRKQFVKFAGFSAAVTATGGIAGCANRTHTNSTPATVKGARAEKAVYVPNGKNRFQKELMIWGVIPFQIKVSGKDTDGSFFVFEHAKMSKGGPPDISTTSRMNGFTLWKGNLPLRLAM